VSSRVKRGDAISVLVADGQRIVGRFAAASDESLAMHVDGAERSIPAVDVREVVVAHGTNRKKLGAVVGGLVGALVGQSGCYDTPTYVNEEQKSCAGGLVASVAAFTAIGTAIGISRWRPAVVFVSSPGRGPVPPVRSGEAAPAPPAPALAPVVATARPHGSLDLVATRVKPFERIYVRTRDGREMSGDFRQASATMLQLDRHGETVTVAAADVQKVFLRGGTQGRRGMLWGLALGAGIGTAVGAMAPTSEWSRNDNIAAGALLLGSVGVIYGGLGGLLVHSRSLVYEADAP
jgi:hypothetical protein